jgi:anti-anti-sigma regulatory factor
VAQFAGRNGTEENKPRKRWDIDIEWQRSTANTTVVKVAGDLRGDGAASMRRTLAGELTGTPELLVLDLSGLEEIDADGVDALRAIAELAEEDGIRFCLVVPPNAPACQNVGDLTKTFETSSSVTEALQHP